MLCVQLPAGFSRDIKRLDIVFPSNLESTPVKRLFQDHKLNEFKEVSLNFRYAEIAPTNTLITTTHGFMSRLNSLKELKLAYFCPPLSVSSQSLTVLQLGGSTMKGAALSTMLLGQSKSLKNITLLSVQLQKGTWQMVFSALSKLEGLTNLEVQQLKYPPGLAQPWHWSSSPGLSAVFIEPPYRLGGRSWQGTNKSSLYKYSNSLPIVIGPATKLSRQIRSGRFEDYHALGDLCRVAAKRNPLVANQFSAPSEEYGNHRYDTALNDVATWPKDFIVSKCMDLYSVEEIEEDENRLGCFRGEEMPTNRCRKHRRMCSCSDDEDGAN